MHIVNLALLVISLAEPTLAIPSSPCSSCGLANGNGGEREGSSKAYSGKSGHVKSARSKGNHMDDDSRGRKEDEKEGHKYKDSGKEDKTDNDEDGEREKDDQDRKGQSKDYDSDDKSSHGYTPTSSPLVSPAPYVNSPPASPAPHVNSTLPSAISPPPYAVQPTPATETPTVSSGNIATEPVAEVSVSPVLSSSINIKFNAVAGSLLLGLVVVVL